MLETIRLLSNFETPHCKLLQIILAGQPELGQKLERPELLQLLQRITVWKRLEALSEAETAGYIRHRMRVAGHLGEDMFEPDALALIADRSQGIPRNINKICFHALLEGYAEERARLSAEIVQKVALQLGLGTAARPRLLALRAAAGASAGSATSAGTSTTNATPGTTASPGNAPSPGTASSTAIATSTANTRKDTATDTDPAALGVTPVKNSVASDATVPTFWSIGEDATNRV